VFIDIPQIKISIAYETHIEAFSLLMLVS